MLRQHMRIPRRHHCDGDVLAVAHMIADSRSRLEADIHIVAAAGSCTAAVAGTLEAVVDNRHRKID